MDGMATTSSIIAGVLVPVAAVTLLLAGCGSNSADSGPSPSAVVASEAMESEAMESEAPAAAASSGAYITLAQYEGSKDMYADSDVVLFFAADWCPTCQEAAKNLEADPAAIPTGLAIVRVDYDNSDELKQKYGVTTQHTFVQVDADGNELAKWTGSTTADEIAGQTA